ncbi:MAG: hypothetical protein J6V56_03705 [Clostridia bacterium]|nr:hypothetical protein [Clostridia bacterium]
MKNNKQILISILLIAVICFSLFSCVAENNVSQAVSQPETSSALEEQPILIMGDFKPEEEAFVTYEEALKEYGDPFIATLAASAPKEARMVPQFNGNITQIRISVPERHLVLDTEEQQAFQIYYGYCSDGKWYDMPADNYEMKTLHDLDSGYSDGWDALTGNHVVKIGNYVLLGFYSPRENSLEVKDSLNSSVLTFTADSLTEHQAFQVFENALAGGTEKYDYYVIGFGDRQYIALEYDKIPTNYTVSFSLDFGGTVMKGAYTYYDIMEALNRK